MIITKQDTLQTLAKKYGTTTDAILKANPTIGTTPWVGMDVNIPGASTLEKTLPKVGDESSGTGQGLPNVQGQGGSLSAFSSIMKEVMNKAAGKARDKGLNVMQDRMAGLRMPGASLGSIMDVVEGQTTKGFKDIYTSTINYMSEQKEKNWNQLQLVISEDALPQFSDEDIKEFATINDMDPAYLMGVKLAQKAKLARQNAPTSTESYKTLKAGAMKELNSLTDAQFAVSDEIVKSLIKKKEIETQVKIGEILGQPPYSIPGLLAGGLTMGIGTLINMKGIDNRKKREMQALKDDLELYASSGVYNSTEYQTEIDKRYKAEGLDMDSFTQYLEELGVKPSDIGLEKEDTQKQAMKEINDLRTSKTLPTIEDNDLRELAMRAGYDPAVILAIKKQQESDAE